MAFYEVSQNTLPMTEIDWLKTHYMCKIHERRTHFQQLPLLPNTKVLDLACGPGFYTVHFADLIAPSGQIHAVDISPTLINHAKQVSKNIPANDAITFHVADIRQLPFLEESFDSIIAFNVLCYFKNYRNLIEYWKKFLRPGGSLILKDADFMTLTCPLLDQEFLQRLLTFSYLSPFQEHDQVYLSHFKGQTHFSQLGSMKPTSQQILQWPYTFSNPLTSVEKRYLSVKMHTLLLQAQGRLTKSETEHGYNLFNENSSSCIFSRPDFYICVNEVANVAYF